MSESPRANQPSDFEERRSLAEAVLVKNLCRHRAELIALLEACSSHWGFEDHVYRFYHQDWLRVTRPIVEAFFHARFFLDMAVRYSDLEGPPRPLPSGYAALLYLYNLR